MGVAEDAIKEFKNSDNKINQCVSDIEILRRRLEAILECVVVLGGIMAELADKVEKKK